ncbi:hypothetical protein FA95DRAFT_96296 [Auriscalpium vulgare]|uniref:Uncharacterized protein n=1 Tax=Auriscalpium vulgare TaxID=40419 RepID=A0ACB8RNI4_9AGAM|nr:hypothetical protein FA95DRAFT_96296 [Auriscalpium vulgare]
MMDTDTRASEYWKSAVDGRISLSLMDTCRPAELRSETASAAAVRLQALDEEIDAITTILLSVKALRNAHAPGAPRLPPEILSQIFSFAKVADPPTRVAAKNYASLPMRPVRFTLGWIVVTHVCTRWRQVALADATLWSELDSFNLSPAWCEKFSSIASSSTSSKLSVVVDWVSHCKKVPPTLFVALKPPANKRLRSLKLFQEPGDDHPCRESEVIKMLCGHERGPAPLLESLTVENEAVFNFPLPLDFLATETPRLRSLSLFNSAISWYSPFLRHLVHLSITLFKGGSPLPPSYRVSKSQLHSALSSMPALETISLEHALDRIFASPYGDMQVISLPSLVSLFVKDQLGNCAQLMSLISVPSSAGCALDSPEPLRPRAISHGHCRS